MAFDFPSSPTVGQQFTPVGGVTFVWNGYGWDGGSGILLISDTAPTAPSNGSLWWESDTGTLWIYYTDANTSQWVAAAGGGGTLPGMTLLSTITATAAASVDFTSMLTSQFNEYEVHFNNVYSSVNADNFLVRYGQSAVYISANYYYAHTTVTEAGQVASAGGAVGVGIPLSHTGLAPNAAVQAHSGKLTISAPLGTTAFKHVQFQSSGFNSSNSFNATTGGGCCAANANPVDSLRFLMLSGNISGTFKLYGVR